MRFFNARLPFRRAGFVPLYHLLSPYPYFRNAFRALTTGIPPCSARIVGAPSKLTLALCFPPAVIPGGKTLRRSVSPLRRERVVFRADSLFQPPEGILCASAFPPCPPRLRFLRRQRDCRRGEKLTRLHHSVICFTDILYPIFFLPSTKKHV